MKFIQRIFNWIEIRRGSKNWLFIFLVALKDVLWFFSYYIPKQAISFFQNKTQSGLMFFYSLIDHYRLPVDRYYKISLCITCMNRSGHLRKTLRKNIKDNQEYPNLEFVLLDYNSGDGLEDWVFANFQEELRSGLLAYYRTTESSYFKMARAKNIAHQLAKGDIVCNLDADNFTGKDFAFYINLTINRSDNIIGLQKYNGNFLETHIDDCGGRIFLTKNNFLKLGGYNEKFVGWGKEDREFIIRAGKMGMKEESIPRYFLGAIRHSNYLRTKNMQHSIKQADINNDILLKKSFQEKSFRVDNPSFDPSTARRIKLKEGEQLLSGVIADEVMAITTFFNPCCNRQKLANYHIFQKHLRRQGVKLLTIELAFKNQGFVLKDEDADYLLSLRSQSVLWQKERLLNIALKNLPPQFRYVIWLDCDIIFLNNDWLVETVKLLQNYPVVQCFSQAVYLKRNENWQELIKEDYKERFVEGFAGYYQKNPNKKLAYGTAGGFAWAARREILEIAGFYDTGILGSGDWKMIESFIGCFSKTNKPWNLKVYEAVKGKIASVPGVILHLYHGELKNRLYGQRQIILDKCQFNPERDLELNKDGCWRWSKQADITTKKAVKKYFELRNEKNNYFLFWRNQKFYQKIPGLKPGKIRTFTIKGEFNYFIGQVGIFLKKHSPAIYKILKRRKSKTSESTFEQNFRAK